MFGTVTVIASIKYGSTLQPSILETLPTTIPLHIAALLVAIQLCLTSAIGNSALYQQVEECMQISRGKERFLELELNIPSVISYTIFYLCIYIYYIS